MIFVQVYKRRKKGKRRKYHKNAITKRIAEPLSVNCMDDEKAGYHIFYARGSYPRVSQVAPRSPIFCNFDGNNMSGRVPWYFLGN